jgi:hypothetical protein
MCEVCRCITRAEAPSLSYSNPNPFYLPKRIGEPSRNWKSPRGFTSLHFTSLHTKQPRMSSTISLILNQQISHAVSHLPAGTYSLPDDAGKLSQEILISLGLIERTSAFTTMPPPPPPPVPSADTKVDTKVDTTKADTTKADTTTKARTRTVSKKMKDAFLASSPDKTEDDLKRVSKAYKDASDADIAAAGGDFVSFGNHVLASAASAASAPPPPAKTSKAKEPKEKKPKTKTEKTKPRLAWSAAEKKVFASIVTDVTDDLKADFAAYIDSKSDDDFKAFAMAGHMRAWFDARITPKAGNGEFTPEEYDLARGIQNEDKDADADEDEDEDLEEIDIDGEQLLIGTKSGDIFQSTEEAGDVKIGRAGEGKFKNVKKP